MSSTKQRHCWSGMLAIGALVLSARAGMVRAGSSATPNETYRATEVISHVLGSKQAVGYFLTEATLNAALAIIDSMQPRSELQALLAVQIIATGFAGLRFLRQSHRQMTEDYIDVYGGYAVKLLRLQNDMIQTFERYRRGNKQTVEVRHVHIHSGGQGVVGIINPPDDRDAGVRE
jgi:hypothetical protein